MVFHYETDYDRVGNRGAEQMQTAAGWGETRNTTTGGAMRLLTTWGNMTEMRIRQLLFGGAAELLAEINTVEHAAHINTVEHAAHINTVEENKVEEEEQFKEEEQSKMVGTD
eukprot:GHVS01109017.1.p2 GENE.GHVS01109017.1~~GHVS01109017.1.p2  ORF type:complete len:112 (+),score=36.23 GHVS01109017.1:326-661(+)